MLEYKESIFNLWQEKNGKTYLVNTLSKGIVSFTSKDEVDFTKSILSSKQFDLESSKHDEYRKILLDNGFVLDQNIDEIELLKNGYSLSFNSEDFLQITLLPTMKCNFGCIYCFEEDKATNWDVNAVERLKIYSRLNFLGKKNISIVLFGGEPTLEWSLLKNYLDYVFVLKKEYGFELDLRMTTNAYLINDSMASDIVCKYKFSSLQITVDCNRENHNKTRPLKGGGETYDQIIKNIKSIIDCDIKTSNDTRIMLRVNLVNNKLMDIEPLLYEFTESEKKHISIYFRPAWNTNNFKIVNKNSSDFELFYFKAKEHGFTTLISHEKLSFCFCEGDSGKNVVHILPDLSIYKCINVFKEEYKVGYISESGKIIFDENKLEQYAQKNPFNDERCLSCKYLPMCFGGCPVAYLNTKKRSCFSEKTFDMVSYLTGVDS